MAADVHGHDHEIVLAPGARRAVVSLAAVLAALVALAMLAIGLGTDEVSTVDGVFADETYEAKVASVTEGPCEGTTAEQGIRCLLVDVELTQGPDRGEQRTLSFTADSFTTPDLASGDRLILNYAAEAESGFEYTYADRQRRPVLFVAAVMFAIAVVLLGRLRGLAALGGLVVSVFVILQFVLPAILEGHSPVVVAVVGAAAIAYAALYLAHGFTLLTTVALLGTLSSLALIVVLSAVFTALGDFTGFTSEEASFLGSIADRVDVNGLVLGGIVIGALGALDDVTVTQAAAVAELRAANPGLSARDLYRSGLRIGRDHIASTVNTLALAYAGAALPLLLLFVLAEQSLGTVANSEVVATEIVRALVGSIGLVAAVPITTWLAATVTAGAAPARRRAVARRRAGARGPRREGGAPVRAAAAGAEEPPADGPRVDEIGTAESPTAAPVGERRAAEVADAGDDLPDDDPRWESFGPRARRRRRDDADDETTFWR
jgi:uncharacterized membrane protein